MKAKLSTILILSLFLISCSTKQEKMGLPLSDLEDNLLDIPNRTVDQSRLFYNPKNSLWTLDDELYSGFFVSYYRDSLIKEKGGILNGKKQNEFIQWFSDGHYKQIAHYHKGKLHGEKKMWTSDSTHVLIAHLNYHSGKAHGLQKKWYPTGELFKVLNLRMGKEEGIQQAFRKNGDLYANYEAKEGRIFGLKKASLCFGLEDEKIQYAD